MNSYQVLFRLTPVLLTLLPVLSVVGLAAFVWRTDTTELPMFEPFVMTVLLGMLFAYGAAFVNAQLQPVVGLVPLVGPILFFYLVVAPVEEVGKWLAIRVYTDRSVGLDSAVEGLVYGAVAGVGFASIENTGVLVREFLPVIQAGGPVHHWALLQTAARRALVGSGHVLYSMIAGYYLGLARSNAGAGASTAIKGLLVAVFLHGTYNTFVSHVPLTGPEFVSFVVIYNGLIGLLLYAAVARRDEDRERIPHLQVRVGH